MKGEAMSEYSKETLENMLEDVVNELYLSEGAIAKHGPLGTPPAELVRLVLNQKDQTIRMLKAGMEDARDTRPIQETAMSELKCPNCGSSNTVYSIPDWEHDPERGNFCTDPGWFECKNCCYHTGFQNTEDEIHAVIKSFSRTTQEATNTPSNTTHFLKDIIKLPESIQVIMRNKGIVFDNLEDKKQWLAMSIYSTIIDLSIRAEGILKLDSKPWTTEAPSVEGEYNMLVPIRVYSPYSDGTCLYAKLAKLNTNVEYLAGAKFQGPLKPGGEV